MASNKDVIDLVRDQFQQVNDRLDKHYDLFQAHTEKDERAWDRISGVENDLKVTKRVAYSLGVAVTTVAGWFGLSK